jgi:hypothetical protein
MFRYRCGIIKKNGQPCNGHCLMEWISKRDPNEVRGWSPCRDHREAQLKVLQLP